jgi:hypothetical protein
MASLRIIVVEVFHRLAAHGGSELVVWSPHHQSALQRARTHVHQAYEIQLAGSSQEVLEYFRSLHTRISDTPGMARCPAAASVFE